MIVLRGLTWALLGIFLVLVLGVLIAGAEEPVPLPEPDRLRLRVLVLEREVIRERFARLKAEADFAHAEKQGQITALAHELAVRDGFDLETWTLDEPTAAWKPRKETPR